MKTRKFEIASFLPAESDDSGNIYIDWPSVHRQAGREQIQWLKTQDPSECQLVVEYKKSDPYQYLVAEFYCEKLATLYSLMWAK